jgi:steroid delta-isomerase-like uncharacterized protein
VLSNEANIQLLQESLEALNSRDADRFMATIHEEVTWSLDASKEPIAGKKGLRAVIEAMIAAMPDMNYELQQILGADDDHVIIRYVLRGTHEGEFMGIAPTHHKVKMHGCVISKIKDGKRYQMWQYASGPGLLEQLGASSS